MISHLFVRYAESIVQRFDDDTYLVGRLKQLSELYTSVSPDLAATLIGIGHTTSPSKCQAISIKINQGVTSIKNAGLACVFFCLQDFRPGSVITAVIGHPCPMTSRFIGPYFVAD